MGRYYYDMAGRGRELPERSLEPPDCWREGPEEEEDEEAAKLRNAVKAALEQMA